ncbi:MAG: carboxypeptidase-like regulatory domain-containing protein, partial [Flavobacteriales bacterium]|nr:carboxypeptidase-like regulatory domain-containing protein [Flavobacteriales bacterium]
MYRSFVTLILALAIAGAQGQSGVVAGTVTTDEGGSVQPMPFVNVVLKGTTTGTTTDLDGKFRFDVPAGEHVLVASFVGYEPFEKPFVAEAGKTVTLPIVLKTLAIEMDVMEVVHKVDREREAVQLMERRESTDLVQNIGAQELKKKGANDVAAGVQKMVGLSVVGGRYLYVRGMGDRYNSAYLNGLPLPSPDPDAKVAPLDIFPTSVVN